MGNQRFNVPREGWEGELPADFPETDSSGLYGGEEIAPQSPDLPDEANYGLSESGWPSEIQGPEETSLSE